MDEPDLVLVGECVALGPLRRDLAALQARWTNSPDVRFGLERTAAGLMIYDRTDLAPVGNATLFSINHVNATSKYGILLGERRGKGFGTEAT